MTNHQPSPTVGRQDSKQMLAEQQAMAKANRPRFQGEDPGSDPIAAALKQLHDAVAGEDLPDDFLRLLDEIDTKIASKNERH